MPLRLFRHALAACLGATLAVGAMGCAQGDDGVDPRGGDGGRAQPDTGPSGELCLPPCPTGQTCRAGACVSDTADGDGDGVPATRDCDDADPSVGAAAERSCTGACGNGVERCTNGVWAACTAPTTCDCVDGTSPRVLDCGTCGEQRQVCLDGTWVNDGPCMESGVCTPGATEDGAACGCGGLQRRTCQTDCSWGAYECVGGGSGGECTAGQTDTQTVSCGRCDSGTMTRTRTCGSDCRWGAFVDGACTGETGCVPGETRTGCDPCGHEVCSASCTWGACQPAPGNACLRIRPGTTGPEGNNWQCCGSGRWQFCLSSCQWSSACDTCSGCGC